MTSAVVTFGPAPALLGGRQEVAAELLALVAVECPALADRPDRERVMAATWLAGYRSARTRRAYGRDLAGWLDWLSGHSLDPLGATRVLVDVWVRGQLDAGAAHSTVCRRLSAVSAFYTHLQRHDLVAVNGV